MEIGIYKLTNLKNNKIYIGQSINIKNRWNQHKNIKNNTVISRAIFKYGWDNFKKEVIEYCKKKELNEKEIYWINFYNCLIPRGYNVSLGGQNTSNLEKIKRSKKIKFLLKNTNLSIKQIGEKFKISSNAISEINNGRTYWESNILYPIRQKKENKKENKFLFKQEWDRIKEKIIKKEKIIDIAKEFKCSISLVEDINQGRVAYDPKLKYPLCVRNVRLKIKQIDKDNKLIKIYNSIAEASKITNIDSSSIAKVCKNQRKTAGGYKWEYIN